jgi:Class II histone deacetylase complex subunits 2 and 3
VSFTSMINLKERLQSTTNQQAHEEIRKLTSYPKKTPSLASSATGASLLSTQTTASSASTTLSNLRLVTLGENEHILAVSATGLQVKMSRGVLGNRHKEIQAFCLNAEDASEETVTEMKDIMERSSEIAMHPFMAITPTLPNTNLSEKDESGFLVAASGKFVALGKILDALQEGGEARVGIMVGSVRGIELVEGFVRGKGIKVIRTDASGVVRDPQVVETRGLTVTLVQGGKAGSRAIVHRVDVVIAMDLSFNPEDDQALRLRQHPINVDQLSPVIRLVTQNSSEHVRLCLPLPHTIPSDKPALQALVTATTLLRNFTMLEIPNADARYPAVAAFIREKRETDVFGIRDVSSYVAGHRGLAGLALKRARSPTADDEPYRKRLKTEKPVWQVLPPTIPPISLEADVEVTLGGIPPTRKRRTPRQPSRQTTRHRNPPHRTRHPNNQTPHPRTAKRRPRNPSRKSPHRTHHIPLPSRRPVRQRSPRTGSADSQVACCV